MPANAIKRGTGPGPGPFQGWNPTAPMPRVDNVLKTSGSLNADFDRDKLIYIIYLLSLVIL